MEAFIRSKYERKQYLKKDGLPPNKPTSTPTAKETKSIDKVRNKVHYFFPRGHSNESCNLIGS